MLEEGNSLVGAMTQMFDKYRENRNYKDYGMGWLLLGPISVRKKNIRLKVVNHQYRKQCESQKQLYKSPIYFYSSNKREFLPILIFVYT